MNELEKAKMLFDYTKFHIGIYTTLGTILVSAFAVFGKNLDHNWIWWPLWVGIALIGIAGLSGGVIATRLPECDTLDIFFKEPTGFWGMEFFKGKTWTRIEHTAFWFGILIITISFAVGHEAISK